MAELLHHHQQDMGGFVVDQIVEKILAAVERLVAGGDRKRDRDIARVQGRAHHRRHSAALRHDADATASGHRDWRAGTEGQRDAVHVIDVTETVWTRNRHAVIAGDARNLRLKLHALRGRLRQSPLHR